MPCRVEISAIIPTRNRAPDLRECLAHLAAQTLNPDRFEVIVVLDGPDPDSAAAAAHFDSKLRLMVHESARAGISSAKNNGLALAQGGVILLLNDDVRPSPDLLETHLGGHRRRTDPAMIVGHSPFKRSTTGETVFDRLIAETSMIFFYDRMIGPDGRPKEPADHDWGFRHAWNLNLSLPRQEAVASGGFRPAIANCCYEDIEFAYRVGVPVHFDPRASAVHDHRYTLRGYLDREFRLGYSAYGFAHAAPDCAKSVFRMDLRTNEARDRAERDLEAGAEFEQPFMEEFGGQVAQPAGSVGPEGVGELYRRHLPLKRLWFCRGLLAAFEGRRVEGLFHPCDRLESEAPLGVVPAR